MIQQQIKLIPPITRTIILTAILILMLTYLEIVNITIFYYNWNLITQKFQVWRLFTSFFCFGDLSLITCFDILMLYRFCSRLEEHSFKGNSINFLFTILVALTLQLGILHFQGIYLFSSYFFTTLIYLWSRFHPHIQVLIFGIIPLTGAYLPWFYLLIDYLRGKSLVNEIIALTIGHFLYFFIEVFPKMPINKGLSFLNPAPNFFIKVCKYLGLRDNLYNNGFFDEEQNNLIFGL